jgi:acetyl/propionyl-CoA carboxylase alpha subunit
VKKLVRINGKPVEPLEADIIEAQPGVYSIIAGLASWEARVAGNEIVIGDYRFLFEIDDPRQWKRSGHTADAYVRASIAAAMPGKIVRILVAVGDEVVAGQGILVVEAMKMQNELKAPRDGRVIAIEVRENDSVNAGAVLATIE